MTTLFKWLGIILGLIIVVTGLFFVGMRFHDGPLGPVSGGPFRSGEPAPTPDSWEFIADRQTIEFQTVEPPTSRTVWLAVHDERLFLISGYMTTTIGGLWKQWPHYIEENDHVILRIDGQLYDQRLERIQEGDILEPVLSEFGRKYGFEGTPEVVTSGYSWLFEVMPR